MEKIRIVSCGFYERADILDQFPSATHFLGQLFQTDVDQNKDLGKIVFQHAPMGHGKLEHHDLGKT